MKNMGFRVFEVVVVRGADVTVDSSEEGLGTIFTGQAVGIGWSVVEVGFAFREVAVTVRF